MQTTKMKSYTLRTLGKRGNFTREGDEDQEKEQWSLKILGIG